MLTRDLNEICNHPFLSREAEYALGVKAFAGDVEAQNELVSKNLKLVTRFARQHVSRAFPYADCINIGTMGLMKAAKKYNPEKFKTRFSTIASLCIMSEISNAKRTYRAKHRLITYDEHWAQAAINEDSLEEYMNEDRKDELEQLGEAITKLSPADQFLLKARYGLAPNTRVITMWELAEVEGVTKQAIEQREKRAMERLRAIFRDL